MDFIPDIARLLGVDESDLVLGIGLLVAASNIVSRLIPDNAIGWLATLRTVAKFIGLHVQNRVAQGVKTSDVVKAVVGTQIEGQVEAQIREMAADSDALIPAVVEAPAAPVLSPFERFKEIAESNPIEEPDNAR